MCENQAGFLSESISGRATSVLTEDRSARTSGSATSVATPMTAFGLEVGNGLNSVELGKIIAPSDGIMLPGITFNDNLVFLDKPASGLKLRGTVSLTPQGNMSGAVQAIFPDDRVTDIAMLPNTIVVTAGDTRLDLMSDTSDRRIAVDGRVIDIGALDALAPFMKGGEFGTNMPNEARALYALSSLALTPEWIANARCAQVLDIPLNWCKAAALVAAGILTGIVFASCGAICAAGTVVSLGLFSIPCAELVAFCVTVGGNITFTAAYDFVLSYWNP